MCPFDHQGRYVQGNKRPDSPTVAEVEEMKKKKGMIEVAESSSNAKEATVNVPTRGGKPVNPKPEETVPKPTPASNTGKPLEGSE